PGGVRGTDAGTIGGLLVRAPARGAILRRGRGALPGEPGGSVMVRRTACVVPDGGDLVGHEREAARNPRATAGEPDRGVGLRPDAEGADAARPAARRISLAAEIGLTDRLETRQHARPPV